MVYIDDSLYDFDLPLALQQISPQRREQALRFRHEQGQRECVLSYLLLKRALLQEYGIDENPLFEYGEHGKPSIVGHHDIHFSLSHCRQAVACVVSDHPVGIDIETVRAFREPLARYAMNDQELALIVSSSRPDVAFDAEGSPSENDGRGHLQPLEGCPRRRSLDYHHGRRTRPWLHLFTLRK